MHLLQNRKILCKSCITCKLSATNMFRQTFLKNNFISKFTWCYNIFDITPRAIFNAHLLWRNYMSFISLKCVGKYTLYTVKKYYFCLMMEDLYLWLSDPDPGGPKTYGSGSPTLQKSAISEFTYLASFSGDKGRGSLGSLLVICLLIHIVYALTLRVTMNSLHPSSAVVLEW